MFLLKFCTEFFKGTSFGVCELYAFDQVLIFLVQGCNLVLKLQNSCFFVNHFLGESFILVLDLVVLVLYNSLFTTVLGQLAFKLLLIPFLDYLAFLVNDTLNRNLFLSCYFGLILFCLL